MIDRGSDRYFLTEEREVTKEEYVGAERHAGFHNTMGRPHEPATASFSANGVSGRIRYGRAGAPQEPSAPRANDDDSAEQHKAIELVEIVIDRSGFASTIVRDLCHGGRRIVIPGGYVREAGHPQGGEPPCPE